MRNFCDTSFWDTNLTWYTQNPSFTQCFEDCILAPFPTIFLLCFGLVDILNFLKSREIQTISFHNFKFLLTLKFGLNLTLIAICATQFAKSIILRHEFTSFEHFISSGIEFTGYIGALLLFFCSYSRNIYNSGVQFLFWFFSVICHAILFRAALIQGHYAQHGIHYGGNMFSRYHMIVITFPIIVIRFVCEFIPVHTCESDGTDKKQHGKPNPDKSSCFPSKIFFCWYDNLALTGYQRTIEKSDLWTLNSDDKSAFQFQNISKYWNWDNGKNRKKLITTSRLVISLLKCFGLKWVWAGILKLCGCLLIFVQPEMLRRLIYHISSIDEPAWQGYFYMAVLSIAALVQSVLTTYSDKRVQIIGMRIKAGISNAIYRKALVLSTKARKECNVGEMMNLISVDVQKFMDIYNIHNSIAAPFLIGIASYFLYKTVGMSAFVGLGVLCLLVVVSNLFSGVMAARYQEILMKLRDERIKVTSEALSGIKTLKMYSWETSFQERIENIRKSEMLNLWKLSFLAAGTTILYQILPFLVTISMFGHYVLSDTSNRLTAGKMFVVINLVNIFKGPITLLPLAVSTTSQIYVSLKRIVNFLKLEELNVSNVTLQNSIGVETVIIDNGMFSWNENQVILKDINVRIKEGELVAVVGRIGSGKSSLLSAILGEMKKQKGLVQLKKESIAYVSQTSWIQNASLRDNILLDDNFDSEKYHRVIDACALEPDIQMLPGGDQTEIGEKGINLSGGQKQRVSLARAAYKESSLYLLDDPFSAVDSHVARHIFENLIGPGGILDKRTRIIVTHNTSFLHYVDRILVMTDGKISESQTYQEFLRKNEDLVNFMEEFKTENSNIPTDSDWTNSFDKVTVKVLQKPPFSNTKLVVSEKIAEGITKLHFYVNYFKSAGMLVLILSILSFISCGVLVGYTNLYLANWSITETLFENTQDQVNISRHSQSTNHHLIIFGVLGTMQGVCYITLFASLTLLGVLATKKLHSNALRRVMRSPMSYFETTLMGSLISRLARDVEVIDFTLPQNMRLLVVLGLNTTITFVLISITTPLFIVFLIPMVITYFFLQRFYVTTSRQLRRLESVSRTPIYSHFSETISGVSTIRAFQLQQRFIAKCEKWIDANIKCQYPFIVSNLWISLRLELIGTLVIFFTCLFVLLSRHDLDAGAAGLSITFALNVTILLNFLARQMADFENNIVSVERVGELTETPQENGWNVITTTSLQSLSTAGEISFVNYDTRYRSGLDLVLQGITCKFDPGEKIGVVGRTGSGKSSLTLALFRMLEPSGGKILIDGVDISTFGIEELRRKITIIPQEPVLFSGSLRDNIDPCKQYSDDQIWRSVELAHLKEKVLSFQRGLECCIEEDGKNFSVGQRQLICLARALLRRTQILILDEATAAVDMETDDLIQATIRKEFVNSTVITVAHRLSTILDSDKILVLENGRAKEFDSPEVLLSDSNSQFWKLAQDAKLV